MGGSVNIAIENMPAATLSDAIPAERSVLIVEDDQSFLQRLAKALESRGFAVTTAESVADGLLQIEHGAPAFAVVDMRLGDGNGLDVITALKRRRPEARGIILTGYGNIATAVNAIKLGAVDYLAKPVDADDVVAALLAQENAKIEPPENPMSADRVRWEHIQRIYELCGRNVSETARRLNMHRRTLQRILAKSARRASRRIAVRPGRIDQRLQPHRRRAREQQHHRLARGGRQFVLRRRAFDFGAEGIGHDQPGVGRENLARHLERCGEEQAVAMRAIVRPFLIGAEIGDRGFDLDDPDLAARVERDQIGAAAGRQRQFADHARSRARAAAARCRARPRAPSPTGGRRREQQVSGRAGSYADPSQSRRVRERPP